MLYTYADETFLAIILSVKCSMHQIINAEVTVAQKPNQGTAGKGGVIPCRGLFFVTFFGQAKKVSHLQTAGIRQKATVSLPGFMSCNQGKRIYQEMVKFKKTGCGVGPPGT